MKVLSLLKKELFRYQFHEENPFNVKTIENYIFIVKDTGKNLTCVFLNKLLNKAQHPVGDTRWRSG
jgi:hypothetical protein